MTWIGLKIPKTDGLDWGMDWVVSWIGLNDNFWTGFWTVHNYDNLSICQFVNLSIERDGCCFSETFDDTKEYVIYK